MVDTKALGDAIQDRLEDLTIRDAADQVGISHTTLVNISRGVTTPALPTYVKLCRWLGVSTEEFVIRDSLSPAA